MPELSVDNVVFLKVASNVEVYPKIVAHYPLESPKIKHQVNSVSKVDSLVVHNTVLLKKLSHNVIIVEKCVKQKVQNFVDGKMLELINVVNNKIASLMLIWI